MRAFPDSRKCGSWRGPAAWRTFHGKSGLDLKKPRHLLHDFFGLTISRPGLLGHLRRGGQLFALVVDELQELLRQSSVVQGDEAGWRIDGQPAWA